jgi:predicted CopG family antitoxin
MAKKLTITVEDEVYEGLHKIIGRRRISSFLNDLARPHVTRHDLADGYRAMAADEEREREAAEWVDNAPTIRG